MCQRFSNTAELAEIEQYFNIDTNLTNYRKRYNISPTQELTIVMRSDHRLHLESSRWGLFPFWGKDAVNANIDTVYRNPSYPKMIDRQRCVIPCNGFYYWRTEGKKAYPVRVVLPNRQVFGIAGLYETWRDTRKDEIRTCTLLMTSSNEIIREFDERMPAILSQEGMELWLDAGVMGVDRLKTALQSYEQTDMHVYPVSPIIANDNVDVLECIEPIDLRKAWVKA